MAEENASQEHLSREVQEWKNSLRGGNALPPSEDFFNAYTDKEQKSYNALIALKKTTIDAAATMGKRAVVRSDSCRRIDCFFSAVVGDSPGLPAKELRRQFQDFLHIVGASDFLHSTSDITACMRYTWP